MGTWINDMREQPLALDYIIVSAPDSQLPRVQANFFESLVHEVSAFIASLPRIMTISEPAMWTLRKTRL